MKFAVKKFSLATLMESVLIVAVLLAISRIGYWPSVVAWSLLGCLLLTAIPSLIADSPRLAFITLGATGGICGCWVGSQVYFVNPDESTQFLTTIQYDRLYWMHRLLFVGATICSVLVGSAIGLGMFRIVRRSSD